MQKSQEIKVETIVGAPLEKVWACWTEPKHIMKWAFASDDWEAPTAENDLRVGGKFMTRMSAKDNSAGFDFGGVYTKVEPGKLIEYTIEDGRRVSIQFMAIEVAGGKDGVRITQLFDMEHENSEEKQREGWQAILENFRKYVEA